MFDDPGELNCKQVVELVNDYLEGAMPLKERTELELHLAYCGGCAEYLRQLRQLGRAAARLREEDLPEKTRNDLLDVFRAWKTGR